MFGSASALMLGQKSWHILIDQPLFHLRHRKDVAIADDQIDVVQRDAFGTQAIVDDFSVKAAGVLFARDSLFCDGERDRTIAQKAGTHIMVVGVEAENVSVLFGHGYSSGESAKNRQFVGAVFLARPLP